MMVVKVMMMVIIGIMMMDVDTDKKCSGNDVENNNDGSGSCDGWQ